MSTSQPAAPDPAQRESNHGSATDVSASSLLPYAQLGLRLLGVMMIVDGAGAVLGGLAYWFVNAKAYWDARIPVPADPQAVGWIMAGIPSLLCGLYFVVNGAWVLKYVFSPAPKASGEDVGTSHDVDG